MKYIFVVLMCLVSPSSWADKKLVCITQDNGSKVSRGDIEYDSEGRVTRFEISHNNENGHSFVANYIGSESIEIIETERNPRDEETYTYNYTLSDGKLLTVGQFFDQLHPLSDGVNEYPATVFYENNKIVRLAYVYGGMEYMPSTMTWNGDNPAEWKNDNEHTIYTYNTISTHPIIHAIFGFWFAQPSIGDMYESLMLYPYYGDLPKGLFEHIHYEEYRDTFEYDFAYETDSDGYVTKAVVTSDYRTWTYTLEWEGTASVKDIPSDNTFSGKTDIYTLDGRRLQGEPTQKGVYIRNGKAIVIK